MNELTQAHAELMTLFPGKIVGLQFHIGNYLRNEVSQTFSLCIGNVAGDFNSIVSDAESIEDLMKRAKHYVRTSRGTTQLLTNHEH